MSWRTPPPAPTAGENYESWIKAYHQYAPERRAAEMGDIETQLALARRLAPELLELQRTYMPEYNRQQLLIFNLTQELLCGYIFRVNPADLSGLLQRLFLEPFQPAGSCQVKLNLEVSREHCQPGR